MTQNARIRKAERLGHRNCATLASYTASRENEAVQQFCPKDWLKKPTNQPQQQKTQQQQSLWSHDVV